MKKTTKAGIALAIAGSLASLTAVSPALATPIGDEDIYVGPSNAYWYWNTFSAASMSGLWNDVWENNNTGFATWDSTDTYIFGSDNNTNAHIECADPADLSPAADSSGDQILTCDPQIINNGDGDVTVQTEYRFYADGQTWRQRHIITNNTVAAIDGQVLDVGYNSYQDGGTALSWTSAAGLIGDWTTDYDSVPADVTSPTDLTWVTDNRTDSNSAPVVKYAVGSSGSSVLPADDATRGFVSAAHGNGNDQSDSFFELPSLAAGQSVEIITLNKVYLFDVTIAAEAPLDSWQTATRNTVLTASADTALESNAVVFAGISDISKVLNWTPTAGPAPTPEPVLANTGLDATALASLSGLGLLALIAGSITLIGRRRRTATN